MKKISHPIFLSTASYYLINFSDYFISLILLPFLSRTLLPEGIGLLGMSHTLGIVLFLIIEYGFSLSATRDVANNKNKDEISLLVSKVLIAKFILIIPCMFISIFSLLIVPIFQNQYLLIIFTLFISIFNGFTPLWYFQGIQKIYPFALLKILIRVLSIIPVFIIVRSPSDFTIVLLFQCISSFLTCTISLFWVLKKNKFTFVSFRKIIRSLVKGWHTFSLSIAPPLCSLIALFWLSTKLSIDSIGLLNSADRIFKALISLFGPIGQAIYPFLIAQLSINRLKAINQTKKALYLYTFISLVMSVPIFIFAEQLVVWFLGKSFIGSVIILKLFVVSVPLIKISHILGRQWMLSIHLDKIVNIAVIISSIVFLISVLFFYKYYKILSLPISVLISEIFLLIYYLIYLQFKKIGFWNKNIDIKLSE